MRWRAGNRVDCSFVEVVNHVEFVGLSVIDPDLSSLILDVVLAFSNSDVDDFGGNSTFSYLNLLLWTDGKVKTFLGFGSVNFSNRPPLDPAVTSRSDKVVSFLEEHFDHPLVQEHLFLNIK